MLQERSKTKTRQSSDGRKLQMQASSNHEVSDERLEVLGRISAKIKIYTGSDDYVSTRSLFPPSVNYDCCKVYTHCVIFSPI
jgi:hypothetical protein